MIVYLIADSCEWNNLDEEAMFMPSSDRNLPCVDDTFTSIFSSSRQLFICQQIQLDFIERKK